MALKTRLAAVELSRKIFFPCNKPRELPARLNMSSELNIGAEQLKAVIGLEIHAQIASKSKLFSGASTAYGKAVNTQVSHFDAALPGTLPVLNKSCVIAAIKTALAFQSHINKVSMFDRKHYFYADMPAGYQITQQRKPIAVQGQLEYVIYVRGRHRTASKRLARIHQIQLEQDSGKSIHDDQLSASLIDLNRAGVALMEIVTEPDFESGEEAETFVREVQSVLRSIDTCDGRMEQGSLRVDANISVHIPGDPLGVRTEVKNLNSLRAVQQAIDFEIERQKKLLSTGHQVINETMSFDAVKKCTVRMRDKEVLQDYRFMAEPNLPPIVLSDKESHALSSTLSIESVRSELPELRHQTRQRLLSYGLKLEHAIEMMELHVVELFDQMLELSPLTRAESVNPIFSFIYQTVLMVCGERKMSVTDFKSRVDVMDLTPLWVHRYRREITPDSCKKLLHEHLDEGRESVVALINSGRFDRIVHENEISSLCENIILNSPQVVNKYLRKQKKFDFDTLRKAVLVQGGGRVAFEDANRVLRDCLDRHQSNYKIQSR